MNKADLIDIIAKEADITKVQANKAIDAFTDAVIETLKTGGRVTLVGFGSFTVSERKERNGRNPRKPEIIKIQARKVPKFRAGKEFAEIMAQQKK
jgi:DNA-binding protein HU-beta